MANILVHLSVFTCSVHQSKKSSFQLSVRKPKPNNHSNQSPTNYSVHVADEKHGKHVQVSHYWFWFHSFYFFTFLLFTLFTFYSLVFLFDEKVASVFQANRVAYTQLQLMQNQLLFDLQVKTSLIITARITTGQPLVLVHNTFSPGFQHWVDSLV